MIKYNMEMRSFIRYYIALFFIFILVSLGVSYINLNIIKDKVVENNQAILGQILVNRPELEGEIVDIITLILVSLGVSYINLNIIKDKVVENNQAILGQILVNRPELEGEIVDIITQGNSKENIDKGKEIIIKDKVVENNQAILGQILVNRPELEGEIVDIITQGNSKENIDKGKEILGKYNYDENITLRSEPIIYSSKIEVINVNLVFLICIFTAFIILALFYFKKIYNDINDMTEYVYNSSEGRSFEMKNRNQEGQIGILKTELLKMTNILKEKVELLNKEKIFLNDIISDISHQLKTPMTSLIILNDLMYDDLPKETKVEFLDKIKSQLSRMEWLIKSMLKLSKVEAKVINFENKKINIKELINKSISPSLIPIELKNIDLSINGDEKASYIGDINWSSEALVNIIKNCVEHTNENGSLI